MMRSWELESWKTFRNAFKASFTIRILFLSFQIKFVLVTYTVSIIWLQVLYPYIYSYFFSMEGIAESGSQWH